ncbi:prepilin-type N-terminal cleavage/methylation domain-containing protein, partial [Candidatus Dojkabacteria bacterium]|nr:prepilin-type N-terminal cleavage/methylation domain-containing protein [Candidatus Dojkabacteria bacterium]
MNRKYSGFTLIEMLIVMGIIIILMIVGITAARFAINRA